MMIIIIIIIIIIIFANKIRNFTLRIFPLYVICTITEIYLSHLIQSPLFSIVSVEARIR